MQSNPGPILASIAVLLGAPLAAETLPTPYRAEQIRDAFQEGLEIVTKTWTPHGQSLSVMRVKAADDEEMTFSNRLLDEAWRPVGHPTEGTSSWIELRDHASFPAATARRERRTLFTALGRLEGWLYRVESAEGDSTSLFFADDHPGPPVLYESREGDQVVSRAEQLRRHIAAHSPSALQDVLAPAALPPLPPEALRRLEYALGSWHVRAEDFDPEGGVARTTEWRNHAEWLLPGRLVLLTHDAPELGSISKTLVFYSIEEETWYLVDTNQNGQLWILSGGLEREVITSRPKKMPDGRTLVVRFTHENVEADSFEALMEISFDQGETWRESSRQYLRRLP